MPYGRTCVARNVSQAARCALFGVAFPRLTRVRGLPKLIGLEKGPFFVELADAMMELQLNLEVKIYQKIR